ncbi:hypothetical protein CSUI_009185 [Cystoisospora suis]|uniref:Transmembrane protein n=1 Tax=Cystoisospora suis TaxID=483139 RepID=A0A2C6KIR4_9APIC|nr:hypothetical protein CSUI_009185 [Cystoisospora suis]
MSSVSSLAFYHFSCFLAFSFCLCEVHFCLFTSSQKTKERRDVTWVKMACTYLAHPELSSPLSFYLPVLWVLSPTLFFVFSCLGGEWF